MTEYKTDMNIGKYKTKKQKNEQQFFDRAQNT